MNGPRLVIQISHETHLTCGTHHSMHSVSFMRAWCVDYDVAYESSPPPPPCSEGYV